MTSTIRQLTTSTTDQLIQLYSDLCDKRKDEVSSAISIIAQYQVNLEWAISHLEDTDCSKIILEALKEKNKELSSRFISEIIEH